MIEELVFARTSKRKWFSGTDEIADKPPAQATAYVQQYKFIRLEKRANYEPLIMCLKGLQLAYNPAEYLTFDQLRASPKLQEQFRQLKAWAAQPTQIRPQTISKFVRTVRDGLMSEGHRRPVHKTQYIDWALSAIDLQLHMFNQLLEKTQNIS